MPVPVLTLSGVHDDLKLVMVVGPYTCDPCHSKNKIALNRHSLIGVMSR